MPICRSALDAAQQQDQRTVVKKDAMTKMIAIAVFIAASILIRSGSPEPATGGCSHRRAYK